MNSELENSQHSLLMARLAKMDLVNSLLPFTEVKKSTLIVPLREKTKDPVAVLYCFTRSDYGVVFPLKIGVNRVGRDLTWGDYERSTERIIEGRQFLLICNDKQALIADDHSTNQSVVIPHDAELPDTLDFRRRLAAVQCSKLLSEKIPGKIDLDWAGDTVAVLRSGDFIVNSYAAFVFAWLPPQVDS